MFHWFTDALICWLIDSLIFLVYWFNGIIESLAHWFMDWFTLTSLIHWLRFIDSVVHWFPDSLIRSFIDSLIYWFTGSMASWFLASLVPWCLEIIGSCLALFYPAETGFSNFICATTTTTTTTTIHCNYSYSYNYATPRHTTPSSCGWAFQKAQLQPPFGPSADSRCHPCITTTRPSYSVLFLKLPPLPCAVLLIYLNLSFIHSFIYLCIYVFVYFLFIYLLIYLFIWYLFLDWFMFLFIYLLFYLYIYLHWLD